MTSDFVRGFNQEVYNMVYDAFPDKKQASSIVSLFEKTLTQLEVNNKVEFNERLDLIISKVKEKLGEEFATKADLFATKAELEAGLTKLELRIAQSELKLVNLIQAESEKLRAEFKNDIKEVMTKNLDDKIKSFKYSVIVWIIGGIGIGVINILLTYFKH